MEENTLHSIQDIFSNFGDFPVEVKPLTKKEKREILMREIFSYYKAEAGKRKMENWKRYCKWCRENRLSDIKENQQKFKKTRMYIKEMTLESLSWLLRHIPQEDLHYFVSTGKEFSYTDRSFGGWLTKWFEKVVK
jgi:hemerythrin